METQSPYLTTTSTTNFITGSSSIVVINSIIEFKRDGEVVGKLDATIDFKDLNPDYHQTALQLLHEMPVCLYLESKKGSLNSSRSEPVAKQLESGWEKFKRILRLN